MLKLIYTGLTDTAIRNNFKRIEDEFNLMVLLRGKFEHFIISIPKAVTNYRYKHGLGFMPKDIIQTSIVGSGLTWNYSLFDKDYLDITTTGEVTVRGFIGSYQEQSNA